MKKQTVSKITSLSVLLGVCLAAGVALAASVEKDLEKADAYSASSLTTTINLNPNTEQEIRNYYSALDSLPESERKGTNLLKNLKNILKKDQKYYSYESGSNIWKMYEITDRDWAKSPASEISGYNASTNIITGYSYGSSASNKGMNPYLHALYVDRNVDNKMHAWARESDNTTSHGNNKEWGIDREHIWPKSHGFEDEAQGGARGDPMHLWPGDSDVNSSLHSNEFYGFVNITSSTKHGKWSYANNNYVGTSLTLGTTISSDQVFEPQDCDKGDIARACFYMVARYNYLSGSDSDGIDANNPNLTFIQDNTSPTNGYMSSTTVTGNMGILTDLLAWHHLDPVDEFEIKRNNILYRNYTNNRNPFIDFPEWVDYIWGTATYSGRTYQSYDSTPTGVANRSADVINGYKPVKVLEGIAITSEPTKTEYYVDEVLNTTGLVVTATYDDASTEDVTANCSFSVDTSTVGTKEVNVSYTYGGVTKNASFNITVSEPPFELQSITLSGNYATEFELGDTFSSEGLVVTAHYDNGTSEEVIGYTITGYDMNTLGTQTVTVSYTLNGVTKTATYQIRINEKPVEPQPEKEGFKIQPWMYIVGGVVIAVILIGIISGVVTVNKKGKLKVKKSGVKKIVKGNKSSKKTKK